MPILDCAYLNRLRRWNVLHLYDIAVPIGAAMDWLVQALGEMQGGGVIVLGLIIGAMTAIDMGGPNQQHRLQLYTSVDCPSCIHAPNGAHRIAVADPAVGNGHFHVHRS